MFNKVVGALVAAIACGSMATAQLRYDKEYEGITYHPDLWKDPVAGLRERIESGEVELTEQPSSGYLTALLDELDIPVSSQSLVFTKTSVQRRLISPRTPRALYFSDDVYVAWVPESRSLEIIAIDPTLGPVFYTLDRPSEESPDFEPQTFLCLRCHDSYSLSGGGVPRLLMGSMIPDAQGEQVFHEGWSLTSQETPIPERWGGWYVTGTHGDQTHMGNVFVKDQASVASLDSSAGANVVVLGDRFDVTPYLSGHSDIVALLVLEHQVHVQNAITRVSFDARTALARDPGGADAPSTETEVELDAMVETLVRALLFADEAPLGAPFRGTTSFASEFTARGPRDADGRSLRDFDLQERLFRFPLSYLIYADAFDALPEAVHLRIYGRLRAVLRAEPPHPLVERLGKDERSAVLEILEQTKEEFALFLTTP